jgi:hypothetical protein
MHKTCRLLVQISAGIILGMGLLQFMKVGSVFANDCGGDPNCRMYAVSQSYDTDYTAIHGRITYGDPAVRDGGMSQATLWIGDPNVDGTNYIELGWRKQPSAQSEPYILLGVTDANGAFQGYRLGTNTQDHYFQIEHKLSDNKWHIYLDGQETQGSPITLGVDRGRMVVGGEVTDFDAYCCPPSHNAMGVAGFTNLTWMKNHQGYYAYNGFQGIRMDDGYQFRVLGPDHAQASGNN